MASSPRFVTERLLTPRPDAPPRPLDWLRGVRILIVEDHDDHRLALRLMIESFGATVRVAAEGYDALAIAEDWPPDLILCDLMMPGMDGYTFMRRLQDDLRLRGIRVVAVSALGRDADLARTRLAGFEGHLVKPIDYDVMVALLERVLREPRPT